MLTFELAECFKRWKGNQQNHFTGCRMVSQWLTGVHMVSYCRNSFRTIANRIFLDASPAASRMPAFVPGSKGYIENGDRRSMRDNPHKYLLYKPSLSQLMVFLSSGFKELPPGGALLLYISADGCFSTTKHPQDCEFNGRTFVKQFTNI